MRGRLGSLLVGLSFLLGLAACRSSAPVQIADDPLPLMRGAMQAHLAGDWEASNHDLQKCLRLLQKRPQFKLGEQLGAAIVSEKLAAHEGEAYEQVFLHSLGMLNFAMMAKADEALVEARRSDVLQGWLRREGATLSDDPLARLLAAKLYEHQGHWDDARIDLEKAREAYRSGPMRLPEPSFLAQDLASLKERSQVKPGPQSKAELWVLVYSGQWSLTPGAKTSDGALKKGAVWANAGPRAELEPVMDLMPLRKRTPFTKSIGKALRASSRVAVRIAFLVGLTYLGGGNVPADYLEGMLEEGLEPDDRHWDNLPSMIHAARLHLTPGVHQINVSEEGGAGRGVGAAVKMGPGSMSVVRVQMVGDHARMHISDYLRP